MLKKLKTKFIVINMTLVSIVLISTFAMLLISSSNRMKQDSMHALQETIKTVEDVKKSGGLGLNGPPRQDNSPFMQIGAFTSIGVVVDSNDRVTDIVVFGHDYDEEILQAAITSVLEGGGNSGTVKNLNLRYLKEEDRSGNTIISFVDIGYEKQLLQQQATNYVIIGMLSLIAFFIISLILSKLALKPVEKSWKQQQQFIADASHELKTPVAVMLANTSILLSDNTEDKTKWIKNIEIEAKRMKQLVEDLLFLSRVESESDTKVKQNILISDTIMEVMLPFEAVAFEQGKIIESDIESDVHIKGDEGQIKQLLSILIDNACKYAEEKSTINLSLNKENNKAILKVNNKSEPIPQEDLEHLFDRFYKVDKARTRTQGSYGLGLAIAKEIVNRHNGKISVTSTKQDGTTFTIVFPL